MPNIVSAYDVEVCRRIKAVYAVRKKDLGITTYSLAKQLDVSQSFIAHIMTGRVAVPLRTLLQLAEALDTSPEQLDPKFNS